MRAREVGLGGGGWQGAPVGALLLGLRAVEGGARLQLAEVAVVVEQRVVHLLVQVDHLGQVGHLPCPSGHVVRHVLLQALVDGALDVAPPLEVAGRDPLPPEVGKEFGPRAVVLVGCGELAADPLQAALGDGQEGRPRRRPGVGRLVVPAAQDADHRKTRPVSFSTCP